MGFGGYGVWLKGFEVMEVWPMENWFLGSWSIGVKWGFEKSWSAGGGKREVWPMGFGVWENGDGCLGLEIGADQRDCGF